MKYLEFFVHHNSKTLRSDPAVEKWVQKWEGTAGLKNPPRISRYSGHGVPEQTPTFQDTLFSNNQ